MTPYDRLKKHLLQTSRDVEEYRGHEKALNALAYPKFKVTYEELPSTRDSLLPGHLMAEPGNVAVRVSVVIGNRVYSNSGIINGWLLRRDEPDRIQSAMEWITRNTKENLLVHLLEELS